MPRVNPDILRWARQTASLGLEEAADRLDLHEARGVSATERLAALESGQVEPTRSMLTRMAKQYRRPLLAFYLSAPPRKGDRGQDFRTLPDCVVSGNRVTGPGGPGGGISADSVTGGVTIARCVISDNMAGDGPCGGIACYSPQLLIQDCLVVRNSTWGFWGTGGIGVSATSGEITGCTVAYNSGNIPDGVGIDYGSDIAMANTIIASNGGRGISCLDSHVTVRCTDIQGNSGGEALCGDDLGGNFSADPLFCNHDDFTLDGQSPCLPGWIHGGVDCGLIGARGQGCGTAPTGACCFSEGSCSVVTDQQCADQHGTYQGNGTTCSPNPCQPTPTRPTTWGRIKSSFR